MTRPFLAELAQSSAQLSNSSMGQYNVSSDSHMENISYIEAEMSDSLNDILRVRYANGVIGTTAILLTLVFQIKKKENPFLKNL